MIDFYISDQRRTEEFWTTKGAAPVGDNGWWVSFKLMRDVATDTTESYAWVYEKRLLSYNEEGKRVPWQEFMGMDAEYLIERGYTLRSIDDIPDFDQKYLDELKAKAQEQIEIALILPKLEIEPKP